jgi:hypothetical protein
MPKRSFFYIFWGVIIILVLALGLSLGNFLFKAKPKEPAVSFTPAVQPPPAPEEKVPLPEAAKPPFKETPAEVGATAVEEKRIFKPEFQKGMMYVAWTESGYSNVNSGKSIEQMLSLGVEWVGVLTTWYQDRYNSTRIYPLGDKTPSDESLIFAIRKLRELKAKIMLKPHLDLVEGGDKWRGDIEFENSGDWQTWFDSYAAFILHYAEIAEKEKVELFCIGTELTNATVSKPELWRDLINKIRQVYKGKLTYAANWDKEFKQISFWDALDYAGVDPYFPLICTLKPEVGELKCVWEDWVKTIEEWQQKINKPVIFTEIGYKSSVDAADEPWQYVAVGEVSLELQVNLYTALLESFWDKPWFYGVYWWYWGTNPRMGGPLNRSFTPQNKPAQEVVKEWYTGKPILEKAY